LWVVHNAKKLHLYYAQTNVPMSQGMAKKYHIETASESSHYQQVG
jgi:hypothetical protein